MTTVATPRRSSMRGSFRECSSQALDGALGVGDELGADDADDDRGWVVVAAEVAREAPVAGAVIVALVLPRDPLRGVPAVRTPDEDPVGVEQRLLQHRLREARPHRGEPEPRLLPRLRPVAHQSERRAEPHRAPTAEGRRALPQVGQRHPGPSIGRIADDRRAHQRVAHRDEVVRLEERGEMAEERGRIGEGQSAAQDAADVGIGEGVADDVPVPGSASRPADADVHRLVRSGGREVERPEPRRRHVAQERLRTDQREERLRAQAQVGVGVGGADPVEGPVEVGAAEPPAAQSARASVSDGEGAAAESDRKRRGIVHPATVPPPDLVNRFSTGRILRPSRSTASRRHERPSPCPDDVRS
ncbi:hypothetical protein C5C36_04535 [Rathayibacter sp. AY1G1]|nr:hypothetical protein C5C36_04535 [Rathayibacter sp. AY1G1]